MNLLNKVPSGKINFFPALGLGTWVVQALLVLAADLGGLIQLFAVFLWIILLLGLIYWTYVSVSSRGNITWAFGALVTHMSLPFVLNDLGLSQGLLVDLKGPNNLDILTFYSMPKTVSHTLVAVGLGLLCWKNWIVNEGRKLALWQAIGFGDKKHEYVIKPGERKLFWPVMRLRWLDFRHDEISHFSSFYDLEILPKAPAHLFAVSMTKITVKWGLEVTKMKGPTTEKFIGISDWSDLRPAVLAYLVSEWRDVNIEDRKGVVGSGSSYDASNVLNVIAAQLQADFEKRFGKGMVITIVGYAMTGEKLVAPKTVYYDPRKELPGQ